MPETGNPGFTGQHKFNLKYAPHFGMFKHRAGEDLPDRIRFMYDAGFRAFLNLYAF